MSVAAVLAYSFSYLAILFAIAYFAERRSARGKSVISPNIYALSLAVYCTAWTYYGSVGRAAKSGADYLLIYLGPTLMAPLWWIVLRKIIRICKIQRITSIADFISSRYGKSTRLGILVTLFCILGIVPYIALQIKAISLSFNILVSGDITLSDVSDTGAYLSDSSFYLTIGLVVFTILFGARKMDVTERHEGMVAAIAFESLWKLIAFIVIALIIIFYFFNGLGDIFQQASSLTHLKQQFTLQTSSEEWFWMMFISMSAIILLPRQFQVGVVENTSEKHILKATWLFPLYLLAINLFVLPIAFGGEVIFEGQGANPDMFLLSIPLAKGQNWMAIIAYLGGLSAATGMIIVSSIALSIMVSNNLIIPLFLRFDQSTPWSSSFKTVLKYSRWGSIVFILFISYAYCVGIASKLSLVSIGLVSFSAVAQFAPAVIGGLFWKAANRSGALWGIIGGFIIWFYTLVFPTIIDAGFLPQSILTEGPWGVYWLKPFAFLGLEGMGYIAHAMFWSMLVNISLFVGLSLTKEASIRERQQAEIFVNIFRFSESFENTIAWKENTYIPDIKSLLVNFLGTQRTEAALQAFEERHQATWQYDGKVHPRLIAYAENLLAGIIGTASARIVVSSVSKEERIEMDKVVNILKESQQTLALNHQLKQTSDELKAVTQQLQQANDELKRQDQLKDEFLYTVTHELRTPLTSVRAMAEILHDNHPEMEHDELEKFLGTIVTEAERLTRLITQVLDLEKFDSGTQKLDKQVYQLNTVIEEALRSCQTMLNKKEIQLQLDLTEHDRILIDRDRIIQVFINLISNAVKFCEPQTGKITIHSFNQAPGIHIKLTDNGCGIDPNAIQHIFDKFYQVKNQPDKKAKGSGLGLAITKKIIQLHGGTIQVSSQLEQG
ncbi:MAG: sodium:solute symporter family transporter, partial [Flammeovirgaceae bacterium]